MPTSQTTEIRSLIGQTFSRSFTIERGQVDTDNRTVDLTFSSETPVERWYGFEILDHSPEAADLSRLNAGGPVLLCHDRYEQIGAVVPESAEIKKKRGHARVLFSQSQRGQEIQNDVNDGIRSTTSFRYIPREMKLDSSKKGVDTYRVTKWEALEISFEPIPADISVGVGRSAEAEILRGLTLEEKRAALKKVAEREGFKLILDSTELRTETPTEPGAPPPASITTQERTQMEQPNPTAPATPAPPVRSADQIRRDEIIEIGDLAGLREFAVDLALAGNTVDEARTAIIAKRRANQAATQPTQEEPETIAARSQSRVEVVSRVRLKNFKTPEEAIRFGNFIAAGVFEFSRAARWCRDHGIQLRAAHSESDNESGGIWVPTEFDSTFVELREKFGKFRQFANVTTMTSDRKLRRRNKGGLRAKPIGAVGTARKLTTQKMKWNSFELIARQWGILVKLEDELTEDAIIDYADKLMGEMAYGFAVSEDEAGFNGDGSAAYHGIIGVRQALRNVHNTIANIKGLVVASGNAWSEITNDDLLKLIAILPEYADNENTAFYCHRTFFWTVMAKLLISAGGVTRKELESMPTKSYEGYPVRITQAMPKTEANSQIPLLFGDLAESTDFGDRRGITVRQTDSNDDDFENGLISIKSTSRFDINAHDVGDTSEPGPILGLITAAA